jgi:hypothetical protein
MVILPVGGGSFWSCLLSFIREQPFGLRWHCFAFISGIVWGTVTTDRPFRSCSHGLQDGPRLSIMHGLRSIQLLHPSPIVLFMNYSVCSNPLLPKRIMTSKQPAFVATSHVPIFCFKMKCFARGLWACSRGSRLSTMTRWGIDFMHNWKSAFAFICCQVFTGMFSTKSIRKLFTSIFYMHVLHPVRPDLACKSCQNLRDTSRQPPRKRPSCPGTSARKTGWVYKT